MDAGVLGGGMAGLARRWLREGRAERAVGPALAAASADPAPETANLASAILNGLGRYAEALAQAERALQARAGYPEALHNRIVALMGVGRSEDALVAGAAAAVSGPPALKHLHALNLLYHGQWTAETWALFEQRLLLDGRVRSLAELQVWRGEDRATRTLLVHAEEGLGDTIQFVRYLPLLRGRVGRVVLAVQRPLLRLLATVPGADAVVAVGDRLPHFDAVAPLLSLPGIFGTTIETVPPPLTLGPPRPPHGSARELRVGLAWRGNPGFANDRLRSLPTPALSALQGLPGVRFFGLHQPGGAGDEPAAFGITPLVQPGFDMADTASAMAGLDVVVSVDTAVAHLAASMGLPVLLLSRTPGCWRWLHGRTDSPWYPALRIIRQTAAPCWAGPLQQVRGLLDGMR